MGATMQHFGFSQAMPSGATDRAPPDLIGLPDLIALAREGWVTLMAGLLIGLAVALLWLTLATVPDWRAEARVQLAVDPGSSSFDRAILNATELERLRGAAVLAEVVTRLGYDRDPGFADGPQTPLGRMLSRGRAWIGGGGAAGTAALADRAALRLERQTGTQLIPGTTVARISASAPTPAAAAAIAQGYAEAYLRQRTAQLDAADSTARAEIATLAQAAEQARRDLALYHASRDADDADGLAQLDREVRSSRARLDQARRAARRAPTQPDAALALRRQTRQDSALAASTAALAPELAQQDQLAQTLADATARLDSVREAWLRRDGAVQRPAILSAARPPQHPVAPATPLVAAMGAAAGTLGALALSLRRDHRRGTPRRIAAALGLRLLADMSQPRQSGGATDARSQAARLTAALAPGPADLAILPATAQQTEAAAQLAADLAAALVRSGRRSRLVLWDAPAIAARLMAPAVFDQPPPPVVHLGAAQLAARLAAGPPLALGSASPLARPPASQLAQAAGNVEPSQVALLPPVPDWRGPALARQAGQTLLVVGRNLSARAQRDLRTTLEDAPLRPAGVIVTAARRSRLPCRRARP